MHTTDRQALQAPHYIWSLVSQDVKGKFFFWHGCKYEMYLALFVELGTCKTARSRPVLWGRYLVRERERVRDRTYLSRQFSYAL